MEPALVPDRPSISTRPSSRNLSITPQPNAPWAPPPCNAKLMRFFFEVSMLALGFIVMIEPFAPSSHYSQLIAAGPRWGAAACVSQKEQQHRLPAAPL